MNVLAWLEFDLAYSDYAVHRFNHYTTKMFPVIFDMIPLSTLVMINL